MTLGPIPKFDDQPRRIMANLLVRDQARERYAKAENAARWCMIEQDYFYLDRLVLVDDGGPELAVASLVEL